MAPRLDGHKCGPGDESREAAEAAVCGRPASDPCEEGCRSGARAEVYIDEALLQGRITEPLSEAFNSIEGDRHDVYLCVHTSVAPRVARGKPTVVHRPALEHRSMHMCPNIQALQAALHGSLYAQFRSHGPGSPDFGQGLGSPSRAALANGFHRQRQLSPKDVLEVGPGKDVNLASKTGRPPPAPSAAAISWVPHAALRPRAARPAQGGLNRPTRHTRAHTHPPARPPAWVCFTPSRAFRNKSPSCCLAFLFEAWQQNT